jgi:hypothetical protein
LIQQENNARIAALHARKAPARVNRYKLTATVENIFLESPAHRAQLFGALHRAIKRADESRQDTPTALPDISSPPIAPKAVTPLSEVPSALATPLCWPAWVFHGSPVAAAGWVEARA